MPGTSLFALIDDIASVLDDVATMTKVATKQTAGVLGDDLALNAEQVSGVSAARELPVVWAVAKGSARNKAVLVPVALLLSAAAPWAVGPLMMLGGAYLCFEGFEKVAHRLLHGSTQTSEIKDVQPKPPIPDIERVSIEQKKIRGAVRTDFILSAEIVVISLGSMKNAAFSSRLLALVAVSVVMTVGVYGLVAGIVKLDDAGLRLSRQKGYAKSVGHFLLQGAPRLMKVLSIAGTIAMFLVGGGILVHGTPLLHHLSQDLAAAKGFFGATAPTIIGALTGLVAGASLELAATLARKGAKRFRARYSST